MDSDKEKAVTESANRGFDWGCAVFCILIVAVVICYLLYPVQTGAVLMWALGGIAAIKG